MSIRTAYKTKTKKLVQRLMAGIRLATFSLGVFIFMGSGVEAGYKRPVSQRKPVQTFTPVVLQNTSESSSSTGASSRQLHIGSFDNLLSAGVVASNVGLLGLKLVGTEGTVTVYRVEGIIDGLKQTSNIKIAIDESGMTNVLV